MNFTKLAEMREAHKQWRRENPGPLISIWNMRTHGRDALPVLAPRAPHSYVYVGRALPGNVNFWHGSPLGNPFSAGPRMENIQKYAVWLEEKIAEDDPDVMRELRKILYYALQEDGIALGCWCYPEPCHAICILNAIEQLYEAGERGSL